MGFYFLSECHGKKINRKVRKEGAEDARNLKNFANLAKTFVSLRLNFKNQTYN